MAFSAVLGMLAFMKRMKLQKSNGLSSELFVIVRISEEITRTN